MVHTVCPVTHKALADVSHRRGLQKPSVEPTNAEPSPKENSIQLWASSRQISGSKKDVLRAPSRHFADKKNRSSRPFTSIQRIKGRCSSRPFASIRGKKKGFLRAPSRQFSGSEKDVLRAPSRQFAERKRVFFAPLHVNSADQRKMYFAPLRVNSRKEKRVFFAPLHVTSRYTVKDSRETTARPQNDARKKPKTPRHSQTRRDICRHNATFRDSTKYVLPRLLQILDKPQQRRPHRVQASITRPFAHEPICQQQVRPHRGSFRVHPVQLSPCSPPFHPAHKHSPEKQQPIACHPENPYQS